jgi:hypothetical protein
MVDIVSIIIAVISLAGSIISAGLTTLATGLNVSPSLKDWFQNIEIPFSWRL